MKRCFTFDDVLIVPKFSRISSRDQCETSTSFGYENKIGIDIPIISANMDTITGPEMTEAMSMSGAIGALHRFCSIEDNIKMFKHNKHCFVSFGANRSEVERAVALYDSGAYNFILDVAHGASMNAVEAYRLFREKVKSNAHIMVGNFATGDSINAFTSLCAKSPDSFKVGIGGGSMCTTRIVTGIGVPTLYSVMDAVSTGRPIIADGGIRNSGDVAKCLAAGAKAVMIGSMLSGTLETPGEIESFDDVPHKVYRGSASKESYEVQNKVANHRTPEGESTYVLLKGSAKDIIKNIRAGVLSAMSYVDAVSLPEFAEKAQFIEITQNGIKESHAHGKR